MGKPKLNVLVLILLNCIPFIVIFAIVWHHLPDPPPGEKFDSAKWIEAGRADIFRTSMAEDLMRRYDLKGMSRTRIDSMLGKPTITDKFPACDYVYWLGPIKGYEIDSEWLCIIFEEDVVTKARIVED